MSFSGIGRQFRLPLSLTFAAIFWASATPRASSSAVLIAIDSPTTSTVSQGFTIRGTTLGGADAVHVWAFPAGQAPVFLGWALTNEPDVSRRRASGGFQLRIDNAPIGRYPIVVYAHDPQTGEFAQTGRVFTVAPYSFITHCWVFYGIGAVAQVICAG